MAGENYSRQDSRRLGEAIKELQTSVHQLRRENKDLVAANIRLWALLRYFRSTR